MTDVVKVAKPVKVATAKAVKAVKIAAIVPAFKLVDHAGIAKNIKQIKTSGKKLETLIHVTALSILAHVAEHGNITQARDMIVALPSLTRKNALIAWFCEFGCFVYNKETKTLEHAKRTTQMETAQKTPFWKFKAEEDFVAISIDKAMERLVNLVTALEKSLEKAPDAKVKGLVTYLKAVA